MAEQGTPMMDGPGTSLMSCASEEPTKVYETENRWMAARRPGREAHRIAAQAIATGRDGKDFSKFESEICPTGIRIEDRGISVCLELPSPGQHFPASRCLRTFPIHSLRDTEIVCFGRQVNQSPVVVESDIGMN